MFGKEQFPIPADQPDKIEEQPSGELKPEQGAEPERQLGETNSPEEKRPSIVGRIAEKIKTRHEWKEVEQLAEDNGLKLHLVSDKEYHQRRRPMPRGGVLYQMGNDIYARREVVSPEEVADFIEGLKKPQT